MQVSSSDHCERTILSTVAIFAKGQINEECVLRNVCKLTKPEFGRHLRPCVKNQEDSLVADAVF